MKKVWSVLLAAVLVLSLAGCSEANTPEAYDGPYAAPRIQNESWVFDIRLAAPQDPAQVQQLEICHNGGETMVFSEDQLRYMGLHDLAAGESRLWQPAYPVTDGLETVAFHFTILAGPGQTQTQSFYFRTADAQPDDGPAEIPQQPAQDPGQPAPSDGLVSEQQLDVILEGSDWHFQMELANDLDETITLTRMTLSRWLNGVPTQEEAVFEGDLLSQIQLGFGDLAPGQRQIWDDWHPIVDFFNEAEYRFTFQSPLGEVVQIFRFHMDAAAPQISEPAPVPDAEGYLTPMFDGGKDLDTLRHEADFAVEVAPGVAWVPARALGESRYTNGDVYAILSASPEEKAQAVSTLYEALQLYQIGGFYASDDNIRIPENGIQWEHHKPGYDAVRTNTGCCATDSNWLNYILRDDYAEVGFLATSQRDGSGHIFNYILHDGHYYFVDLTHYRTDWVSTAVENGDLGAYHATDFVLGNIHRADSVYDYANYILSTFGDPPGLIFCYTAENCLAIDSVHGPEGIVITYEQVPGVEVEVVFDDPNDSLFCDFVSGPSQRPDWSAAESYPFPD